MLVPVACVVSNMNMIFIDVISGVKFGLEIFFRGDIEDDESGVQLDLGIIRFTFIRKHVE